MKKLLFTLAILISFEGYSQEINKTNDGYTEVVDVALTKKEIHQKINEWIAVNYKSAQDVIQLNTEDKVITKGNFIAFCLSNSSSCLPLSSSCSQPFMLSPPRSHTFHAN